MELESLLVQERTTSQDNVPQFGLGVAQIQRSPDEDTTSRLGPRKLATIFVALSAIIFVVGLDENIVATAAPQITNHFGAATDEGWYGSGYLFTLGSFQLAWGRLYRAFPSKWLICVALTIFETGCLVSGFATSSALVIVGRAISGLGSAGMAMGVFVIVAYALPLSKRPGFIGALSIPFGAAASSGPLIGGVLTSRASWRWCFWVNVPIGALITLLLLSILPLKKIDGHVSTLQTLREFDWVGTTLFVPAIISLLLALQWGGSQYAWSDDRVLALLVAFVVLFVGFVISQYIQGERASVYSRFLHHRTVVIGAVYVFILSGGMEIMAYLLPVWFQTVKGASPLSSGIMSLPLLVSFVISSVIAGILVSVTGHYVPFMFASGCLLAVGGGLCSTFTPTTERSRWILFELFCGIGAGLGLNQPETAVQTIFSNEDISIATAVIMSCQILGASIFLSVGNNVLDERFVRVLSRLAPSLDGHKLLGLGLTAFQRELDGASVVLVTDAYNAAITSCFVAAACIGAVSFMAALGMPWRSVKTGTTNAS